MARAFRFDVAEHAYQIDGVRVPSITQMLSTTGWIDDRWYSEESSERGRCVHELTASFDLGALDLETLVSPYRGWLLAYVQAMAIAKPDWIEVEVPSADATGKWAGRPDRAGRVFALQSVLEIKSGARAPSHQIQTALQAMLRHDVLGLPAPAVQRFACYVDERGKFAIDRHVDRRDFDEASRIISACVR